MRSISKYILLLTGLVFFLAACDKKDSLPIYGTGTSTTLSASATTIAAVAADSNKTALTLSWTDAGHATDSAHVKYTVEIDSTGKNFAKAAIKVVPTLLSTVYTAKELNNILLAKGYAFNVPVDMDVRVTSSYANNNEKITSNTIKIKMTPYKIPPKVAVPASGKLFIVGGATAGGWDNPVSTPSQELARIDETTFAGIFSLTAGQAYLLLPINGNWDEKYGASSSPNNVLGDDFKPAGGDIAAPATGVYKLIVDFQTGKFSLTPFTQTNGLPTELYIVGDATVGQWDNPVPVPAQKFTRVNNAQFEIASVALTTGKEYLFLPVNGSWDKKFGAADKSAAGIKLGGPLKPEGDNMPAPEVSGNYKITVNFVNNSYTLVKL